MTSYRPWKNLTYPSAPSYLYLTKPGVLIISLSIIWLWFLRFKRTTIGTCMYVSVAKPYGCYKKFRWHYLDDVTFLNFNLINPSKRVPMTVDFLNGSQTLNWPLPYWNCPSGDCHSGWGSAYWLFRVSRAEAFKRAHITQGLLQNLLPTPYPELVVRGTQSQVKIKPFDCQEENLSSLYL